MSADPPMASRDEAPRPTLSLVIGPGLARRGRSGGLAGVIDAIEGPAAAIRRSIGQDRRLPVTLALPPAAIEELSGPMARARLVAALSAAGLTVAGGDTVPTTSPNVIARVETAFRPDWRDEERLHLSTGLGALLGEIGQGGTTLTLGTLAGAYRPIARDIGAEPDIADAMLRAAAELAVLARDTGRTVALAVEPGPFALMETVSEAAVFFERWLSGPAAERRFATLADLGRAQAAAALRTHLGLGIDCAALAVAGEEPLAALDRAASSGLPVHRIRLAAALVAAPLSADSVASLAGAGLGGALGPAIGTAADGSVLRVAEPDKDALSAAIGAPRLRVMAPQPLSADPPPGLTSTADTVAALLERHATAPICQRIEILPAIGPDLTIDQVIARSLSDLDWVTSRL